MLKFISSVRDLLIPGRCVVCGERLLRSERHVCLSCLADMPYTYFWTTPHNKMADAFNDLIQRNLAADAPYEPYSRATALFYYQGDYEHLTKAVKYGGDAPLGVWLGMRLGERLVDAGLVGRRDSGLAGGPGDSLPPVTAVIPVPMHWRRRWKRGYNQAELIAKGVAEVIGAPLRTDILRKLRATGSQTALTQQERLINVSAAFQANRAAMASLRGRFPVKPGMTSSQVVPGMTHILLVDDVFTTGATLFACRQALLQAINTDGLETDKNAPGLMVSVATVAYAQ